MVRLDLNVPVNDAGHIVDTDADRIKKSLATLEFLKNAGAKTIAISHIGRDPGETLRPVAEKLNEFMSIGFVPALFSDEAKEVIAHLGNGHAVLLENLRSDAREEANDESFARELAAYADIYVNDAFAVSHRNHASIVGLPKLLPSCAGFQLEQELNHLSQAFVPESPSVLVLGGAKFETKLPVIQKFIPIVDHIIIGGALANNFYQARGYEIGKSLIDHDYDITSLVNHPNILLPNLVVVEDEQGTREKSPDTLSAGEKIVDIAPGAFDNMVGVFEHAQFILWNGPMGNYENGFMAGSEAVAKKMAQSGAITIVGGGDSVAVVEQLGLAEKFSFVSTGGGAMLEYLAQGTLPGIAALESGDKCVA